MQKIYLAARYDRKDEIEKIAEQLSTDFIIVSTWHDKQDKPLVPIEWLRRSAWNDYLELQSAEIVVVFTDGERCSGGKHTEFGLALAWGIPILLVGQREQVFHYMLEDRMVFSSPEEFLQHAAGSTDLSYRAYVTS